ncbi:hypothetical protein HX836_09250 [Pseudomonas yamanorum]|uniref:hypothetical protein n=1 Tax=Pseudomonas yamanorum TaxID=515393 RepID=UPI0015A0BCDB|nr:hypothetical protein [Pseudomonas yamanorum]NVZ81980.1 hypothetical protein [Pseudomonas yamanorum]
MPTSQTPVSGVQRRHYDHIKAAIPQSLIHAAPGHPIKRYETFDPFEQELTRRLKNWPKPGLGRPTMVEPTEHQQFFARFVALTHQILWATRLSSQGGPERCSRALGLQPSFNVQSARA